MLGARQAWPFRRRRSALLHHWIEEGSALVSALPALRAATPKARPPPSMQRSQRPLSVAAPLRARGATPSALPDERPLRAVVARASAVHEEATRPRALARLPSQMDTRRGPASRSRHRLFRPLADPWPALLLGLQPGSRCPTPLSMWSVSPMKPCLAPAFTSSRARLHEETILYKPGPPCIGSDAAYHHCSDAPE